MLSTTPPVRQPQPHLQPAQPTPTHPRSSLQRISAAPLAPPALALAPTLTQQQPHPPPAESAHLVPPATPDTDLDPFEHEPLGFEERRREVAMIPYDMSVDGDADDGKGVDESDEERGEMSGLFPGSGIF